MSIVTYRRPSPVRLSTPTPSTRTFSTRMVLFSALVSFFVISLDGSAVNVSLPAISHDIGGGMSGLQWVIDGYTLTFAAFMLSAGVFSDRFGAKRVYAIGLAAFSLASALCSAAPNLDALITARMVQGVAAALMLPTSLALIRQSYSDPAKRARAIAVWTAVGGIAIALGPVVGGAVTSAAGWRAIFLLNVPLGAVGLALLSRIAPSPRRHAPIDFVGQLIFLVALVCLTDAIITGSHSGMTTPVPQMLLVSTGALALFVFLQTRRAQPMLPLRALRTRSALVSITSGFAINAVFYGTVFVLGLYFQQVDGDSPVLAGALFLPMCAIDPVGNMVVMKLARHGARVPLALGQILMAVGAGSIFLIDDTTPAWLSALLLLPLGFGAGLAVPPLTTALLEGVPSELAATSAAVLNTCRQVGSCCAVALLGGLVALPAGFLHGLHTGVLAAAATLVATGTAAYFLLPRAATHRNAPTPESTHTKALDQNDLRLAS